jgi:hypothetical protein
MKRNLLALALAIPLFVISCGKDKNTPYSKTITGLNFTTINATPAGSMGVDDSKASTDSFQMVIYPVPCYTEMYAEVFIYNTAPITLTAKLVNVNFPNAPKSYTDPYTGATTQIVVENQAAAGTVALTQTQNLGIAPPPDTTGNGGGIHNVGGGTYKGQPVKFQFDVSSLPQGFYRLYIETSDGKSFWDNAWISKP